MSSFASLVGMLVVILLGGLGTEALVPKFLQWSGATALISLLVSSTRGHGARYIWTSVGLLCATLLPIVALLAVFIILGPPVQD